MTRRVAPTGAIPPGLFGQKESGSSDPLFFFAPGAAAERGADYLRRGALRFLMNARVSAIDAWEREADLKKLFGPCSGGTLKKVGYMIWPLG